MNVEELQKDWEKYYYMEDKTQKQHHEWDLINHVKLIVEELDYIWTSRGFKPDYILNQSIPKIKRYIDDMENTIKALNRIK